jgi:hypothetical protein
MSSARQIRRESPLKPSCAYAKRRKRIWICASNKAKAAAKVKSKAA